MTDRLNLIETIAREEEFSMLARLMGTSGANALFNAGGDFTVLAPTNDAFGRFDHTELSALIMEPSQPTLKKLLSYHVMPGKLFAGSLASSRSRTAVNGQELIMSDIDGLKINGAGVHTRSIEATNGVIHQIDTVLDPRAAHPVSE